MAIDWRRLQPGTGVVDYQLTTIRCVHNNTLAVFFALLSALTIAIGTVWRHQIVLNYNAQQENSRGAIGAIKRPTWWLSLSLAWLAYGFQAVALGFGTLLVVQPVLVLSLLLTLVLSARVEGRKMDLDESFWATILTIAVGVLVILGRPEPGTREASATDWLIAVGVGLGAMAVTVIVAKQQASVMRAFLLGALCGMCFGYLAVFSKTTVDAFVRGGVPELLSTWPLYALLLAAIVGTIVQQYAFSAGHLSQSLPAMKIFEPLLAYTLGMTLLGEKFTVTTVFGWSLMALAVAAMFTSTFFLSRKPVS